MTDNKTAIWAVVTLTGLVLLAVTVLAALGRPLDVMMTLVIAAVVPTITSILNMLQVHRVSQDVSVVREQTNGNMSRLLDKIPPAAPVVESTPTEE